MLLLPGSLGVLDTNLYDGLAANWQHPRAAGGKEGWAEVLTGTDSFEEAANDNFLTGGEPGRPGTALVAESEAGFVRYLAGARQSEWEIGTLDFSLIFWVRADATPTANRYLFSSQGTSSANVGFSVLVSTSRQIFVHLRDADDGATGSFVWTGAALAVGTWHQVIITCDRDSATGLNAYIDNALAGSAKDPTPHSASLDAAVSLHVGGGLFHGGTSNYLLYHKVITPGMRAALFNAGRGLQYPFGDPTANVF